MTWFKVDDGLHSHRKAVRAGVPAMGLWVLAGSWCADHLTDGFIPDYMAARIDRDYEDNATRLVDAGLWEPAEKAGDKGWQFHEWVEQQPTREEVQAAAAKKSSGGKLGNHRRWHVEAGKTDPHCPFCSDAPSRRDRLSDRSTDRTSDQSTESVANPPSRPDPATSSYEDVEGSPAAPSSEDEVDDLGGDDTTKKGTRVPDDFRPTPQMVEWFRKKCPDVDGPTETAKFVNYWKSKPGKDGLKLSWKRTWQNWMTSAQQRINDRNKSRLSGGMGNESNAPKNYTPDQRCPRHPSNPAGKCGSCRAEQLTAKRSA